MNYIKNVFIAAAFIVFVGPASGGEELKISCTDREDRSFSMEIKIFERCPGIFYLTSAALPWIGACDNYVTAGVEIREFNETMISAWSRDAIGQYHHVDISRVTGVMRMRRPIADKIYIWTFDCVRSGDIKKKF